MTQRSVAISYRDKLTSEQSSTTHLSALCTSDKSLRTSPANSRLTNVPSQQHPQIPTFLVGLQKINKIVTKENPKSTTPTPPTSPTITPKPLKPPKLPKKPIQTPQKLIQKFKKLKLVKIGKKRIKYVKTTPKSIHTTIYYTTIDIIYYLLVFLVYAIFSFIFNPVIPPTDAPIYTKTPSVFALSIGKHNLLDPTLITTDPASKVDYLMATKAYIQDNYISKLHHNYIYSIQAANTYLFENYNFALDTEGLTETTASTSQKKLNLLKPPNKNATQTEINQYKRAIIKYVIHKHKSQQIHPKYILQLEKILLSHMNLIPSWEFDIGKYRGRNADGKLDKYDQLTLTPYDPKFTKIKQNYPFMLKPDTKKEISRQIDSWLVADIIREVHPKDLKCINPLLLVNKAKNQKTDKREYRLTIDLTAVNDNTEDFLYKIPNLMEELHKFIGKNSITKLDLRHAFHHIKVSDDSWQYTGFEWEGKYYTMNVMGFGYKQAVNVFQSTMDHVLSKIDQADAYIDDIYCLCNNDSEMIEVIQKTLHTLSKFGFKLRFDKCAFFQRTVTQLGRTVNSKGLYMHSKHIEKIIKFPVPTSVKQTQSYLGILNWIQCFIPDLHYIKHEFSKYVKGKLLFNDKNIGKLKIICD